MRSGKTGVGEIIRDLRKARGLTQMQLAELIGVSYQQVQKYEKGVDNITVDRLRQIAKALGTPVTVFFPGGAELAAESPQAYGAPFKISDDERALLQLYRNLKNHRLKKAVLNFLKSVASS